MEKRAGPPSLAGVQRASSPLTTASMNAHCSCCRTFAARMNTVFVQEREYCTERESTTQRESSERGARTRSREPTPSPTAHSREALVPGPHAMAGSIRGCACGCASTAAALSSGLRAYAEMPKHEQLRWSRGDASGSRKHALLEQAAQLHQEAWTLRSTR